jgi:thiamine-monophosphate kinase
LRAAKEYRLPLPERELIARVRRMSRSQPSAALARGIGDDCAVVRPPRGHEVLVTTDFSLESVHFRRDWHPAESVGHRCLARGLSDIAAMGGISLAAFLSLALPADLPQKWVDGFMRGFARLARGHKLPLAGGDTAQSPNGAGVLADVVVLGSVPRGKAILRSGARPGDDIFVTGTLGAAVTVLEQLQAGASARKPGASKPRISRSHSQKHYYPKPRLEVGRWLRERGLASAMIDISDGLSTDLSHICEESKTGAWIAQAAVPAAPGVGLDAALHGGDEYELLFTARPAKHDRIPDRIAGVPVRWIGTITKTRGLWLVAPDMKSRQVLEPKGWQHFS